jgi:hypothetical protein
MNVERMMMKLKNTNYLKQKTKDEYIKRITDFSEEEEKDVKYCLEHPKWVIDTLLKYTNNDRFGIHSADKIASCFMALFTYNQDIKESRKALFDSWNDEIKRIRMVIEKKYESNAPTKRQENSYVSYEQILNCRNKMKAGSQDRLLLYMYTEIPPVRNDYYSVRIYKTKPKFDVNNYIVRNENTKDMYLILNDYKYFSSKKKIRNFQNLSPFFPGGSLYFRKCKTLLLL